MKQLLMIQIENETHVYMYKEESNVPPTLEASAHMSATVSPYIKAKFAYAAELNDPNQFVSQNMQVPNNPNPIKNGKIPIIALKTTIPDYQIVFYIME